MRRVIRFIWRCFLGLILFSLFLVFFYKWIPIKITPLMIIRSVENYKNGDKTNIYHNWEPLENISKNLQLAVICSEDQNFLIHKGFDLKAIEKAIENNKNGKRLKGGSTISQQTAKNVFLWPERSWLRKGLEVYFTFLIENIWGKERIMEVYLNSVEMGNDVYGAEAASQYWFKKSASKLSAYEASAIAAILPNPREYKARPATTFIQGRVNWIVSQMGYFGNLNYDRNNAK